MVTAIYLLNFARTRAELDRMCRACFRALRPGGRLAAAPLTAFAASRP